MTLKEGRELMNQLRGEIKEGNDVEFNKQWLNILEKQSLVAIEKGYNKALKNL